MRVAADELLAEALGADAVAERLAVGRDLDARDVTVGVEEGAEADQLVLAALFVEQRITVDLAAAGGDVEDVVVLGERMADALLQMRALLGRASRARTSRAPTT